MRPTRDRFVMATLLALIFVLVLWLARSAHGQTAGASVSASAPCVDVKQTVILPPLPPPTPARVTELCPCGVGVFRRLWRDLFGSGTEPTK